MLREALALEAKGPFALGGRAATLQQLTRVAERRGDDNTDLYIYIKIYIYTYTCI